MAPLLPAPALFLLALACAAAGCSTISMRNTEKGFQKDFLTLPKIRF